MSSTSAPIPPQRFAEAITDLPLANLHFKAAEIRNSISHLESSNQQLQPFADDEDRDCMDAIKENREVIQRMEERILLLRREVEARGYKWSEDESDAKGGTDGDAETNGHTNARGEDDGLATHRSREADLEQQSRHSGNRFSDEELARRLRERMEEDEEGDDEGVHL